MSTTIISSYGIGAGILADRPALKYLFDPALPVRPVTVEDIARYARDAQSPDLGWLYAYDLRPRPGAAEQPQETAGPAPDATPADEADDAPAASEDAAAREDEGGVKNT